MTKIELINTLSNNARLPKRQVEDTLAALDALVADTLANGQPIKLPGLGVFEPREIGPHTGCNPRTGAAVEVPAKTRVVFTASATLKKRLNP